MWQVGRNTQSGALNDWIASLATYMIIPGSPSHMTTEKEVPDFQSINLITINEQIGSIYIYIIIYPC